MALSVTEQNEKYIIFNTYAAVLLRILYTTQDKNLNRAFLNYQNPKVRRHCRIFLHSFLFGHYLTFVTLNISNNTMASFTCLMAF